MKSQKRYKPSVTITFDQDVLDALDEKAKQ